jgi:ribosomal protein RSM22 (predicted rRNA methylase)
MPSNFQVRRLAIHRARYHSNSQHSLSKLNMYNLHQFPNFHINKGHKCHNKCLTLNSPIREYQT